NGPEIDIEDILTKRVSELSLSERDVFDRVSQERGISEGVEDYLDKIGDNDNVATVLDEGKKGQPFFNEMKLRDESESQGIPYYTLDDFDGDIDGHRDYVDEIKDSYKESNASEDIDAAMNRVSDPEYLGEQAERQYEDKQQMREEYDAIDAAMNRVSDPEYLGEQAERQYENDQSYGMD
ncbi:hypothetical protein ABNR98_004475, partial [Salmonella enterica]